MCVCVCVCVCFFVCRCMCVYTIALNFLALHVWSINVRKFELPSAQLLKMKLRIHIHIYSSMCVCTSACMHLPFEAQVLKGFHLQVSAGRKAGLAVIAYIREP